MAMVSAWPAEGIRFEVFGIPAPKGSHTAVMRGRRAFVIPVGSAALKRWEKAVRTCAQLAARDRPSPLARLGVSNEPSPLFRGRALAVDLTFYLARPAARRLAQFAQFAPGDIDKLARATLDPLQGLLFDNDTRIVRLTVEKRYPDLNREKVGCDIDVWPLDKGDVKWRRDRRSSRALSAR